MVDLFMRHPGGFLVRRFLAALAVAGLVASSVGAAQAQQAAQPNWSGLYFGASYGVAANSIKGSFVTSPTLNHLDASGNSQFRSGYVGLQHQWGQFVLGAEASYGGTGWSDDWDARTHGPNARCVQQLAGIATIDCRARIDSLVTVGPRIGFAPSNQWLLFATGGYANARIDTSVFDVAANTEIGRSSNRHSGWFAGGGIEYSYSANLSFGLEYQHVSLDTTRHFDSKFGNGGCCIVTPETRDMSGDSDIIKLRSTFKFNRPEPVAEPMK